MSETRCNDEPGRPDRHQRGIALGFAAAVALAGAIATPFAKDVLPPVPGYMLAFGATMVVTNLILAGLLLSRAKADQEGSSSLLGSIYLFVGLIFLPMSAAFPGALSAGPLIGTTFSAIWIWSVWHAVFGLGIAAHAWPRRRWLRPSTSAVFWSVAALVTAVAAGATVGVNSLPQIFGDPLSGMFSGTGAAVGWFLLGVDVVALALTARRARESAERLWLAVAMVAACFDVWLTFHSGARFSLGWYLGKAGSLSTTMVVLVSLVNNVSSLYQRVRVANEALADLAKLDGLTGLANRRRFDELLMDESRRASRHSHSLALLMLDVDWFKPYNDAYGHQQGDECLRAVAAVLVDGARRPGDTPARYGGEEFALLLPSTDLAGATLVAEKILASLRGVGIEHSGSPAGFVSLSIGIACGDGRDPAKLLRDADGALYAAKRGGRGCVRAAAAWLPSESLASEAEKALA